MTIVIVNNIRQSQKTHTFTAITNGGRQVKIEVEENDNVADEVVFDDVQSIVKADVKVHTEDPYSGTTGHIRIFLHLWLFIGAVLIVGYFFLRLADWVGYGHHWSEGIPIIGGHSIGTGLFRIMILLFPVFILLGFLPWEKWINKNKNENNTPSK